MRDQVLKQRSECKRTFVKKGDYPDEFIEKWRERRVSDYSSRKAAAFGMWRTMDKEIQSLKEKLSQYESGHKGACSTCEVVGELNIELEKKLEGAVRVINHLNCDYNIETVKTDCGHNTEYVHRDDCIKCNWLTQNNQTKGDE